MDNSFNTLIRSLRDNYIQYKITGSNAHKQSYESAENGVEQILSNLQSSVSAEEASISSFYKNDVQEKIYSLRDETQTLHSTLVKQNDDLTAAKIRQTSSSPIISNLVPQYIAIGVLGSITLALSLL